MWNSNINVPQAPVRFTSNAELISLSCSKARDGLKYLVQNLPSIVQPAEATFDNVLRVILQNENEIQNHSNLLSLYSLVAVDTKLQDAAEEALDTISNLQTDRKESMPLFCLVDTVYQKQMNDDTLDAESRKALAEEKRNYCRKGMNTLQTETIGRIPATGDIERRLRRIQSEFIRNLDKVQHSIWLTHHELAGIPQDTLANLEAGTGENKGMFRVDVNGYHSRLMLSCVDSPVTRQRLYLGARTMAKENVALFKEAIQLRHQLAQLLGYPTYLAYKLEITMIKTPAAAVAFLESVQDRLIRHLPKELDQLRQLKKSDPASHSQPDRDILFWSDLPYYIRKFEKLNYSLDHDSIAEYFPLYQTVSKMLMLFEKLFGFVFINMTDSALESTALEQGLIWHSEIKLYSVWDDDQEGGGFVGYLYLDLHPRPGKVGGARCVPLQMGYERPDGNRHYPSTVLLTNFIKPTLDNPSLLQHSDVVLLFHELGHGIHDLSGRCKYARFHGAETVLDFNEAPSQMLENWCWDATTLHLLSGHYQSGTSLPDEVIASLLQTRVVLPALKLVPQLKMTLFDTAVHSTAPLNGDLIDVDKMYSSVNELGGIKGYGDEYGYTSYRHLFQGSDAGMYGYLWSKVLAEDMFDTMFKRDPLNKQMGRRYRRMVLEKGASQDEMDTVVEFLGRLPTNEVFYQSLNLK